MTEKAAKEAQRTIDEIHINLCAQISKSPLLQSLLYDLNLLPEQLKDEDVKQWVYLESIVGRIGQLERALSRYEQAELPDEPTLEECFAAGKGPEQTGTFLEGGLSNTPEERARFEAYMRGHCWEVGNYDDAERAYDTVIVRMLYGVWRDRGLLANALRAHDARMKVERDEAKKVAEENARDAKYWRNFVSTVERAEAASSEEKA